MGSALRVIWRAYRHLAGNGYVYVWANLAFIALSLPIITMPAAWGALCKLSYNALRQPNAEWRDLIDGFKHLLVKGVFMALVNALVIFINVSNLLGYRGDAAGVWALRFLWIAVLVVWFAIQFYMYPLYYAMEKPTLMGAFRNAAVMVLLNPIFTLTLVIVLLLIWSISTVLFALWLVLTVSFMAVLANIAVQDRIRKAGFDQPPPDVPTQVSDEIFYGSP